MQSTVATKTNTIWHTMNTHRIQCPDDHQSVSINFHLHHHRHLVIAFDFSSAGMQNLSISCSLVCLIILGSAALLGSFGIFQRQISAILVTGVMYLLAGESHTNANAKYNSSIRVPLLLHLLISHSFIRLVHIDDCAFQTAPWTNRFRWHRRRFHFEERRRSHCPAFARRPHIQYIVESGFGMGRRGPMCHHLHIMDNAFENYALQSDIGLINLNRATTHQIN